MRSHPSCPTRRGLLYGSILIRSHLLQPALEEMDNLSNELNKLKIDRSKRAVAPPRRSRKSVAILVIVLLILVIGTAMYRRAAVSVEIEVIKPRPHDSSQSAVLVATGYVVAHHKIQVGS